MPPAPSTASYLSHRSSFYSRSRQDSAGSNSSSSNGHSSNSTRGKRKSSNNNLVNGAVGPNGTPAVLSQASILAASKELAKQGEADAATASSSSASAHNTSTSARRRQKAPPLSARALESQRRMLLEDEYEEEAIQHMFTLEAQTMPQIDLMDMQPELRWFMRPYLVDFLIELHQTFGLRAETLYLTLNIVDRYVSKRIVYKRHYQLVGCAALLIAAKYEDSKDRVPTVHELSQMCCNAYDESAFTQMESHVLYTIGWSLGHPTAEAWLRIAAAKSQESAHVQAVARFLMEISLFHRDFVTVASSAIASGALCLSRYINNQNASDLEKGLTADAANVARLLDAHLTERLQDVSTILINKYSSSHFVNAASLVRTYYLRPAMTSTSGTLLSPHQVGNTSIGGSTCSSSSGCARMDSEFDEDDSDRSRCTTPSSMVSTPSRCGMDEDEGDEDDDEDMPVTPLSLHSLHDPLVAPQQQQQQQQQASVSINAGAHANAAAAGKENLMPKSASNGSVNGKLAPLSNGNNKNLVAHRQPLQTVSWDVNMQA